MYGRAMEREEIAPRMTHRSIFGNCVGMMDGSLVYVEERPGLESANDYYAGRKSRYALNMMAIRDDTKRIRALITDWPGAVNDRQISDNSPGSGQ